MSIDEVPHTVAMMAGNGVYPVTFARAARAAGVKNLVAAAFIDETDPVLAEYVDRIEWLRVGHLGKMIRYFVKAGAEKAVMVGQIGPKNLFDLRPDFRLLRMLSRVRVRNAESLFAAIAEELEKDGISLLLATCFLEDHLPAPGHVCGPTLTARQEEDAAYGFGIAKEVSRLDIGQTVVVKKGTVLAVEAFEGTDEAILRGGPLGRGEAMVVKVSKPNQDFRFDVPVVGPATILTAEKAGVKAIVVEARRTMLLGVEELFRLCKEKKISLVARE